MFKKTISTLTLKEIRRISRVNNTLTRTTHGFTLVPLTVWRRAAGTEQEIHRAKSDWKRHKEFEILSPVDTSGKCLNAEPAMISQNTIEAL